MMNSFVGFLIAIGILVTLHEWGHYQTARFFGVAVKRFSVGFGPVIWKKDFRQTRLQLAAIPLGGFVEFFDDVEGGDAQVDPQQLLRNKPIWQRILIVLAGPLINILFAFAVFMLLASQAGPALKPWIISTDTASSLGSEPWRLTQVNTTAVNSWQQVQDLLLAAGIQSENVTLELHQGQKIQQAVLPGKDLKIAIQSQQPLLQSLQLTAYMPPLAPILGQIMPDSAAEKSGLQAGDEILRIDNYTIPSFTAMGEYIQDRPGQTLAFEIRRGELEMIIAVTLDERQNKGVLGVSAQPNTADDVFWQQPDTHLTALVHQAWLKTWQITTLSFSALFHWVIQEGDLSQIAGPIGIAQAAGNSLDIGWLSFLGFLGFLSLSLGILNLLPLPILDGGQVILLSLEAMRGKPLPENWILQINKIGLALILLLTFLALFNDFSRLSS